ncbi:MAG: chromate efflux transporter [Spirochaetaceae bacterium]|nr:MAG: chromate efflux transporter [Spirochaetaceae bacterium]
MSVFLDQLVVKRRYLTEQELIELIALCSILPGPTSTQTIVAVGYKTGGPLRALLTMLVWALPVLIAMSALSFLSGFLLNRGFSTDFLRYVGPMAVGFIIVAAVRIGRKVVTDWMTAMLMVASAAVTFFLRSPWVFPIVLIAGGALSIATSRERGIWNATAITPRWSYLIAFAAFAFGGLFLSAVTDLRLVGLFENFYRYGYLVFGGGQVVVPVMHTELVTVSRYMTDAEFLTGYGLVQGLPGPMFSFAAYAGGMAARNAGTATQLAGAAIGGIGIFLPGLLLIYFVFPMWEDLKKIRAIRIALRGINAVAGGLIAIAAVVLFTATELRIDNLIVTAAAAALLGFTKIPAPLIVAASLALGLLL